MNQIITEYTAEAGLRNLEREIGTICRKAARQIAENRKKKFQVTRGNLHKFLGVAKYIPEMDQEKSQVGLATGLAWTQVGGEVLYVEASLIRRKGGVDRHRATRRCHAGIRPGGGNLHPGEHGLIWCKEERL